jgi:hypothetical protein
MAILLCKMAGLLIFIDLSGGDSLGVLIFLIGCVVGATATVCIYALVIAGSEIRHETKRNKGKAKEWKTSKK